jgi:hypothetical protein
MMVLVDYYVEHVTIPNREIMRGICGAEISNSLLSNKSSSFSPEKSQTALFQKGFLAFGSPARTALHLTGRSCMMSESLHA